jgi:hypothetical protein
LAETPDLSKADGEDLKSPTEGSTGAKTPKTGKPARNPWTIFMRMPSTIQVTEGEIREFFNDAKDGASSFPFSNSPLLLTVVNADHPR